MNPNRDTLTLIDMRSNDYFYQLTYEYIVKRVAGVDGPPLRPRSGLHKVVYQYKDILAKYATSFPAHVDIDWEYLQELFFSDVEKVRTSAAILKTK